MGSILMALGAFIAFFIAYHTYGRFLARRIYRLKKDAPTPAHSQRDDMDYVPTRREVLFGHHYTSIAGTGPIVGPALAVIWGWLPAFLWVVFGSIFLGAVKDFGSLILSVRSRGRSIGDIASDLVNPRVRTLFLLIVFFALWIVIAIFGWVIGGSLSNVSAKRLSRVDGNPDSLMAGAYGLSPEEKAASPGAHCCRSYVCHGGYWGPVSH